MKILLIHSIDTFDNTRKALEKRSLALLRYGTVHDYTLHFHDDGIDDEIEQDNFDVIIFDFTFLSQRNWASYDVDRLNSLKKKYSFLSEHNAIKVAFPQDDYSCCYVCDDWMYDWGVDIIFSPSARFAKVLYPKTMERAEVYHSISGLVDDNDLLLATKYYKPFDKRNIDVGYRANRLKPSFGRFGYCKGFLGYRFKKALEHQSLSLNCDVLNNNVFMNDQWIEFLSNCKFVLGMKGGSSIIDYRGEITIKVDDFMKHNPKASFSRVEKVCFPGEDGKVVIANISPRIFEYAISKSCQILIEDDYFNGFDAGSHYISLKRDFSNIEDVVKQMQDQKLVNKMIDNAYELLITSKKYSYKNFVEEIFSAIRRCNDSKVIKITNEKLNNPMELECVLRRRIACNLFLYSREKEKLKNQLELSQGFTGVIRELLGVNAYYRGNKEKSSVIVKIYLILNKLYGFLFR